MPTTTRKSARTTTFTLNGIASPSASEALETNTIANAARPNQIEIKLNEPTNSISVKATANASQNHGAANQARIKVNIHYILP
jgi:hypothetical protein